MQIFYRNISLHRAIIVACLALCLWQTNAAFGQAQDEEDVAPPITIKLTSPVHNVCMGATLELEAEVTNTSGTVVVIDKNNLWRNFSYATIPTSSQDLKSVSGRVGASGGSSNMSEFITLESRENYHSKYSYTLHKFFDYAGDYTISIFYTLPDIAAYKKQIISDKVNITVVKCN
jgi:hypothetical protein